MRTSSVRIAALFCFVESVKRRRLPAFTFLGGIHRRASCTVESLCKSFQIAQRTIHSILLRTVHTFRDLDSCLDVGTRSTPFLGLNTHTQVQFNNHGFTFLD